MVVQYHFPVVKMDNFHMANNRIAHNRSTYYYLHTIHWSNVFLRRHRGIIAVRKCHAKSMSGVYKIKAILENAYQSTWILNMAFLGNRSLFWTIFNQIRVDIVESANYIFFNTMCLISWNLSQQLENMLLFIDAIMISIHGWHCVACSTGQFVRYKFALGIYRSHRHRSLNKLSSVLQTCNITSYFSVISMSFTEEGRVLFFVYIVLTCTFRITGLSRSHR